MTTAQIAAALAKITGRQPTLVLDTPVSVQFNVRVHLSDDQFDRIERLEALSGREIYTFH